MKTNSVLHGLLLLIGFSLLFACKPESKTDAIEESEEEVEESAPLRDVMYVVHEVKDYAPWKQGFDDHESDRVENGVHTIGVGKNLKNPNKIHLSFFIDDLAKAKDFLDSEDLKSKMEELGVVGPPEVKFMKFVNLVTEPIETSSRVMISHQVNDFDVWKKAYDADKTNRDVFGISERALLQSVDNPNDVFAVFAYNDQGKAEEMFSSPELKTAMKEAGVSGEVDIQFINWEELDIK